MPAIYSQNALKFSYPEEWEIAEEETEQWPRSVTLQLPGGGYWTVYHYPPNCDRFQLMDEVLESLKSEFDNVEIEEADEILGESFVEGYDASFFCLDFLVECTVRSLDAPSGTLVWVGQSESQQFEELAEQLNAIAVSLLANFVQNPS